MTGAGPVISVISTLLPLVADPLGPPLFVELEV